MQFVALQSSLECIFVAISIVLIRFVSHFFVSLFISFNILCDAR